MLAHDLALALDPVRLARAAGIEPDQWQADVLRSEAKQLCLLCARQSGKSTITGILVVDEALHRPPALCLILAPAQRQSGEGLRKVKEIMNALGDRVPPIVSESALQLELANGSRILSLPGKEATVRGYSKVGLIVVDEASRVPDPLYQSVRPMLAVSGGRIVLLSTPWGRRGFFHHEWTEGGDDWHRVKVTAHDVPRISPEWLEAERERIGDWWFAQEYLVDFVDTEDQVWPSQLIDNAIRADIRPLFSEAA